MSIPDFPFTSDNKLSEPELGRWNWENYADNIFFSNDWHFWNRTGNLAARHVRLENPAQPVKYQGVVSTIKDSYGFIERADVVDEIFFHFSEAKNIPGGLKLGDDVEFYIQTRNVRKSPTNFLDTYCDISSSSNSCSLSIYIPG